MRTIGLSALLLLAPPVAAQCQLQELVAADTAVEDDFGVAVDLSDSVIAIGADDHPSAGPGAGAVYVFERGIGGWVETFRLVPDDAAADDHFGASVSAEDTRILAGAFFGDGVAADTGCAYVFDRQGTDWVQAGKLFADDGAAGARFGSAVSLSGDRALVGAFADPTVGESAGSAYVFELQGTDWIQTAKLTGSQAMSGSSFGFSVALAGTRALIGAPGGVIVALDPESAYVFDLVDSSWSETAILQASDPFDGNRFGHSVSLELGLAVIGAPAAAPLGAIGGGAAYVYESFAGQGPWMGTQKLFSGNLRALGAFGVSVSTGRDSAGDELIIVGEGGFATGAQPATGAARAFKRSVSGGWIETHQFYAEDGQVSDAFGLSAAVNAEFALVGSPLDDAVGANGGSAYLFSLGTLCGTPQNISVAAGGSQELRLNAGPDHAGELYWLLGSASGTNPPTLVGDIPIPLVEDFYWVYTALFPNAAPLANSFGVLDPIGGSATATFTIPGGLPNLVGTTLHHAYCTFDTSGPEPVAIFVSNAEPIGFDP